MAYGKGKPRQKTQGRKTLEINQCMFLEMETKSDVLTGSSEARSRQGGDIVPVPPKSEELAPESYDGQKATQVSTAGIWLGIATAGEDPPPPDYYPKLQTDEQSVARAPRARGLTGVGPRGVPAVPRTVEERYCARYDLLGKD